nr:hypothetical protein [Lysinibacillus contaminans]
METTEKLIHLLEEQLAFMKQQNEGLSKKLDVSLAQNKYLSEQVRQLTKRFMVRARRSQNTKHQMDNVHYSIRIRLLMYLSKQKNKARKL